MKQTKMFMHVKDQDCSSFYDWASLIHLSSHVQSVCLCGHLQMKHSWISNPCKFQDIYYRKEDKFSLNQKTMQVSTF